MKPAAYLLSMLTLAAASIALCTPSFAGAPQLSSLTIDDHQNLITVKDDSGKWLFAQVVSTSNLKVSQVSLGKDLSRISLQDETGKTLWSRTLNCSIFDGGFPHGEWSDKSTSALPQMNTSLSWTYSDDHGPDVNQFEAVISPDDQLVTFRVSGVKHSFEITPTKNGFATKISDNKTAIVVQSPASPVAPVVARVSAP